jgi:HK97 family phage portal protein
MTIVGALTRSLENPELPLTSESVAEWIGIERTKAGVDVSEKRALGLTAYLRAITLVSGTCAALPLKPYRNGTRERITQRTVLDNPNPAQTPFEYWQTMYANALAHGTAYATKVRNGAGVVVETWPVHPSRVSVEAIDPSPAAPDGRLFRVRNRRGQEQRLTSWDMLMLPYLSLDGLVGLSVLQAARQSLGVAIAAENNAAQLFGKGSRISGVLQSKKRLNGTQAKALKNAWRDKVAGPDNAGDIAVLDNETEFKPIALPPADAQLLESRRFSVPEIARMFGVPPHLLGDVTTSTSWGSGIEQQTIGFVVYTLRPWLTMVEQRVTRELLPGGWSSGSWYAEYALEGLLRGDSKTRAEFYRVMVAIGAMKPSDVQALENMTPDPAVDFYTLPSNMTVVRPNGEIVPLAAKANTKNPGGGDAPTAH